TMSKFSFLMLLFLVPQLIVATEKSACKNNKLGIEKNICQFELTFDGTRGYGFAHARTLCSEQVLELS
ncbi:MAG: hypothetical protein ACPG77_18200, partial [Nannocystaceae bacterium]